MNKKRLIFLVLFVVIVIIGWLIFSAWNYKKNNNLDNKSYIDFKNMTSREVSNWDEPFLKEIEVKFMEKEDLERMNLPASSSIRLQVLERDEKGNVTAYKKVYSDEDVIRYKLDYSGNSNTPDQISTTSATSTEIK